MVRRAPSSASEIEWHPERAQLDRSALDGIDAVICLSGARIAPRPLTRTYLTTLRDSRIDTTGLLARAIAAVDPKPQAFLVASAVGYYGDTGDRVTDESASPGASALARLCADWESAAQLAARASVRVANLRTGLLLARNGGLLPALKPVVWLGLSGRIGSGRQFMPWISMDDEIAAIRFVLDHDDIAGPVNLTGPDPVRNAELIATLARLMHRPSMLPVPAFALRLVLRDFASEVLGGQRAIPAKLMAAGYEFAHPTLDSALRSVL